MDRELKFRAWDKKTRRMYPVTLITEDSACLSGLKSQGRYIGFEDGYEVDNFTWRSGKKIELMQYTGLKDKLGKEIYEGDVLEIDNKPYGYIIPMPIRDELPCGGFTIKYFKPHYPIPFPESKYCTIIGNIYDNSELLESKGEYT